VEHTCATIALQWTLGATLARLRQNEQVVGLLQIGSLARGGLTPASDYDLVIVLRDAPQAWYVGVTYIDGRFTDLVFVAASALESVQAHTTPVGSNHELVPIVRWLANGIIVFDRAGQVQRAQQKAQRTYVQPVDDQAVYGAWFAINYNLAVAQRMALDTDPLYQTTARIRMAVYGHTDVWFGYFAIRRVVWDGDKAAVRYLQQNDPLFLEVYEHFISAATLEQKLLYYERAARLAAVPLGGVWPRYVTVMNVAQTLQAWQELVGEKTLREK
jgi:hypothetical protein